MDPCNYSLLDEKKEITRSKSFTYKKSIFILIIIVSIWLIIDSRRVKEVELTREEIQRLDQDTTISKVFKDFYKCIKPKLLSYFGKYQDFWYQFTEITSKCDDLKSYKSMDIRPSKNRDEVKYVLFPQKNENITMVTLGIGHDVGAEMELKNLYPNIEFFGADPSSEQNKDLYELNLGGKYFQYAVSDKNGMDQSFVLKNEDYKNELTQHISINSFFKDIIKKSKIDILWIDIEGNEYPILSELHKDGQLDKNGIKICQMNIEFHHALPDAPYSEMQRFHDFVWKILADKKYILMKPVILTYMPFPYIRLLIVNVSDRECTDLYLK